MTTPLPLLTRAQGARVKHLLHKKEIRSEEGAFVVEGAKAVGDLFVRHPGQVLSVVVSPGYLRREDHASRLVRQALAVPQYSCPEYTFSKLSSLESPQGILAVVRQPTWDEAAILRLPSLLGIYGEHLQDPTNVGAIIRTAAALDVTALWLTPDSADIYNPKVIRSTSGVLLSLPVFVSEDVSGLIRAGCQIYAGEVSGRETVSLCKIHEAPQKLILAFGNESLGLSAGTSKAATRRFTIPLSRHVESLNVAATAAIAAFYFKHLPRAS